MIYVVWSILIHILLFILRNRQFPSRTSLTKNAAISLQLLVFICFELLLYVCHVALSFFKRRHVDLQSRNAKDCTRFFVSRTTPKTDVEACSSHSLVTTHWKAFPTAGDFSTVWSAHGFYMFLWFLWFLEIGPGQKRAASWLPACCPRPLTSLAFAILVRWRVPWLADSSDSNWMMVGLREDSYCKRRWMCANALLNL